ncbi:hypothetical protein FQV27_16715 [Paracoccus aurantiacus]|uniref:Beta-ketoacyl synthase N-terminal domain-containing protein n=1 Tax=Paracoccus aurantiacus TaxID=2599412 RepID=A0A5C6RTZ6_9RHOB|nr:hypothetical protein [Paracoccus aurantiacus]TXB65693.1 hypothetical protein FQV27_16715 [Paracoccus aurantiacus]
MNLDLAAVGLASCFGSGLQNHVEKVAARTNALSRQRNFTGSDFKPQLAAFDGNLGFESALTRMETLATTALADMKPLTALHGEASLHIAIALPEIDEAEGLTASLLTRLTKKLLQLALARLGRREARLHQFNAGSAGVALSLQDCLPLLRPGDALLVLATDSYRCRRRLGALLSARRLFSRRDRYGIIPGEAAAALLFVAGSSKPSLATISGVAIETEQVREMDLGGTDFAALTTASRRSIGERAEIPLWLTDWNNGRYRAAELSYCQLRLQYALAEDLVILHLPLIFGDLGAATHGLGLALAAADGNSALLTASTRDSGKRAAIYI